MAQKNKARQKAGQKHHYTDDYPRSADQVKDSRYRRRQKRVWARGRK